MLNLEFTIAVTQNFCSPRNFDNVYRDLLKKGNQTLRNDFVTACKPAYPELFDSFPGPSSPASSGSSSSSESELE